MPSESTEDSYNGGRDQQLARAVDSYEAARAAHFARDGGTTETRRELVAAETVLIRLLAKRERAYQRDRYIYSLGHANGELYRIAVLPRERCNRGKAPASYQPPPRRSLEEYEETYREVLEPGDDMESQVRADFYDGLGDPKTWGTL